MATMTDKKNLEQRLAALEAKSCFQKNVLDNLINSIDATTGNLTKQLYIPQKERDCKFLKTIIAELGYQAEYDEEYNPYHECYCYKIKLS